MWLENIFTQLSQTCTDLPSGFSGISRSTDLRYHHRDAPEERARLETVWKSIWGGKKAEKQPKKGDREGDHKLVSLKRCSVKNGRKKESCAVNLMASLWSHSVEKWPSNYTVEQPSCEESKMTVRIHTEGNTLDSKVLRKMVWTDVKCCVMRSFAESARPDQPLLATKPPTLENSILSMTTVPVRSRESLKHNLSFFFKPTSSDFQALSPFLLLQRTEGSSHVTCTKPLRWRSSSAASLAATEWVWNNALKEP